MQKILRYMQDQALQYSSDRCGSAADLSPRGNQEPQQRKSKLLHDTSADARAAGSDVNPFAQGVADSSSPYTAAASGAVNDCDYDGRPLSQTLRNGMQKVQYGYDNIWQSYEVYLPHPTSDPCLSKKQQQQQEKANDSGSYQNGWSGLGHRVKPKYWVVYIHGGYFRDPTVTSASFHPALSQLVNPSTESTAIRQVQSHVAGYASINYRLAPHDKYPQDESVPAYERREAQWPQMMDDVLNALRHLQERYGFGEDYLLVGHSVGATLAMLAALKAHDDEAAAIGTIQAPSAVAALCGIYDFEALHRKFTGYDYLTRNAIPDETDWVKASPARYSREGYDKLWARGSAKWVLLAQSKNDGLVDFGQAEEMFKVFEEEHKHEHESLILSDLIEIKGKHDEIWKQGDELARVVAMGIGEMMSLKQ
ncbi:hypothetical protein DV737_g2662, partial [Chaetothyriales sp. CBS 132003]